MNATEKKQQLAAATFQSGYNCAQSVLSSFAADSAIERDMLLRLASPFGSGIAKTQETCGAVTGGIMAIGLKYGKGANGTEEEKTRAYELSRQLIDGFTKEHGCTTCRSLMNGLDMNTPEGMAKIKELDLFRVRCLNYVKSAVKLTEEILEKN